MKSKNTIYCLKFYSTIFKWCTEDLATVLPIHTSCWNLLTVKCFIVVLDVLRWRWQDMSAPSIDLSCHHGIFLSERRGSIHFSYFFSSTVSYRPSSSCKKKADDFLWIYAISIFCSFSNLSLFYYLSKDFYQFFL